MCVCFLRRLLRPGDLPLTDVTPGLTGGKTVIQGREPEEFRWKFSALFSKPAHARFDLVRLSGEVYRPNRRHRQRHERQSSIC